jgi:hypothetical protein
MQMRRNRLATSLLSAAGLSGCDPVVNVAGANFPAWLVCAIAGASALALLRLVFVALNLEAYLWHVALVYLSLGVLVACLVYLLFFGRV